MAASHPVAGGDIGESEREERHARYDHHGVEHFRSPAPPSRVGSGATAD
jgi:hypothetical protein